MKKRIQSYYSQLHRWSSQGLLCHLSPKRPLARFHSSTLGDFLSFRFFVELFVPPLWYFRLPWIAVVVASAYLALKELLWSAMHLCHYHRLFVIIWTAIFKTFSSQTEPCFSFDEWKIGMNYFQMPSYSS